MSATANLTLGERRVDVFFAVLFLVFALTSGISDAVPTPGIEMSPDSPNPLARADSWYAVDADPLFMRAPIWMRFVTGLSTFVYGPLSFVLADALIQGKNWIQLPAVIYATMISSITGIIIFGADLFGEPELRTQNPLKSFAFNTPYVFFPLLLLARMRKPLPFTRKF